MAVEHPSLLRILEKDLIDYRIRSRFFHPTYILSLSLSGSERMLEIWGGAMSRAIAGILGPVGLLACLDITLY